MTAASQPQDIPIPAPGFLLEELDGELLLFNPHDGRLLELNATAALVWQLCDGERSISEITRLLIEAFPEAERRIEDDVPVILIHFDQLGAIFWK